MHSVTKHLARPAIASPLPAQRDRLLGLCPGLDFTLNPQARRYARPNRVRYPTDCMFVSGCSPPRVAATQLPLTTRERASPGEGTFTPQIAPAPRRTDSGFRRSDDPREFLRDHQKKKFKEDFFESWVLGIGACALFGIWNLKFGACGLMPSHSAFRDLAWPNFFLLNRRSIC